MSYQDAWNRFRKTADQYEWKTQPEIAKLLSEMDTLERKLFEIRLKYPGKPDSGGD